ncbi:MAG: 23S rRNA (guanosine(2251)-2'-O)-methyltransferase RlmB [Rhodospirillaceae bacterium]|jgi:23S rRNA (guanosine2251-2'-O)-methyltransferase|nr:23S rRNA (guanosine(2251)-2'-O)-methyltransferase RlmB [Rhodospirillaceae bacterium]
MATRKQAPRHRQRASSDTGSRASNRPTKRHEKRPERNAGRNPGNKHWIWGRHAVSAAVANPERWIKAIFATEAANMALSEVLSELPADRQSALPEIERIHARDLSDRLPPEAIHQGLAIDVAPLKPPAIEDLIAALPPEEHAQRQIVLVLDQVTDPHNVGAILRSAAAFGTLAVIVQDRNAPEETGILARSASGALDVIPMVRATNLSRALTALQTAGFWCVGLAGEADSHLDSAALGSRVALVLGSEGDGLRRLIRETCDSLAKLPTQGPISTLNVSNAAAVALYELNRLAVP